MIQYDNPNGASLVMDRPQRGRGPCPFWLGNYPVHDRPANS